MTQQPGFMLYVDDWEGFIADYSNAEIGEMLKALLAYFRTQEKAEFSDRGMRQFFRQAAKAIDLDAKRYTEKCFQNAYNRYRGTCKRREEMPLSFEEWLSLVNERQGTLTTVDDSFSIPISTTNNQKSTLNTNNQLSDSIQMENAPSAEDDHFTAAWKAARARNDVDEMVRVNLLRARYETG